PAATAAAAAITVAASDAGAARVARTVASDAAAMTLGPDGAAASPCAAALSAAANSLALRYRSSGRLASALRTTASIAGGACTLKRDGGNGFSSRTLRIVVVDVPLNGRSPLKN